MPWLILEFVRLLLKLILVIATIVVWAVNMSAEDDTSYIIASGIIAAATLGILVYQSREKTDNGGK